MTGKQNWSRKPTTLQMRWQLDKINDELGKKWIWVERGGVTHDSEALTPSRVKLVELVSAQKLWWPLRVAYIHKV